MSRITNVASLILIIIFCHSDLAVYQIHWKNRYLWSRLAGIHWPFNL